MSSVLPWFFVPEDGVEDGEEFSSDGDESELFRLSGVEEAKIESAQNGIASGGGDGGHIERAAHGCPPAAMSSPTKVNDDSNLQG
jgi:hypothetical protein